MVRVRFAPSPTGSLHLGSALTAVANRRFADERGGTMTLRIDDTDRARRDPGAEAGIVADLEWLGVRYEAGPLRQSERGDLYRAAAGRLLASGDAWEDDGAIRFGGDGRPTLVRADGRATYHLASVVDDVDLAITHVIRGKDHLPNAPLHRALALALGAEPPEYIHHGLLLGADGAKLSKRHDAGSLRELREAGIPPEAVRRYLEELDLPRGDVRFDEARLRRLAIEAIAALPDDDLAARAGAPPELAPALRGARTLAEAREIARSLATPPLPAPAPAAAAPTLRALGELLPGAGDGLDDDGAREVVGAIRARGGDLRALRLALTGAERGPELWAVLVALGPSEARRRVEAALGARPDDAA